MDPLEGLKHTLQEPTPVPASLSSHLVRTKAKQVTLTDLIAVAHDNAEKLQAIADDLVQRLVPVSKVGTPCPDAPMPSTAASGHPPLLDSVETLNRKLERLTAALADVKSRLLI